LGGASNADGFYLMSCSAVLNVINSENIGYSGRGHFVQAGGTHVLGPNADLIIGNLFGSSGTFDLGGTSSSLIVPGGSVLVGPAGAGTFTVSDGGHATIAKN